MKGQAFLALVFLIGSIVVLIGATLAFLATSFIDTGYGYQALTQAEAVANSGVQDALIKIDRGVFTPTCNCTAYSLPVGSSTANVAVTLASPSVGYDTVLSTATVSNRTRKVNVVVAVNASTSQAAVVSWQDIQ